MTTRVATAVGQLQVETVAAVLGHSLFVDGRQWDRVRPALAEHRTLDLRARPRPDDEQERS